MKYLYHANCNDGAGAALSAWLAHRNTSRFEDFIPVQYGNQPPDGLVGEAVVLLDFSYPRDVMIELAKMCSNIIVLDHHKTAKEDLSEPFPKEADGVALCDVEVTFDMKKSGAMLAWEYFHSEPAPRLIQLIQDRDLWSYDLAESGSVSVALQSRRDWRDWEPFIHKPELLKALVTEGDAIDRFLTTQSMKIIQTPPTLFALTGDVVPVYNLPGFLISDTLHLALMKYQECPYAVAFFYLQDRIVYSLRSRSHQDVDVSAIAKKHGGGGHMHAAGFTVSLSEG